MTEPVYNPNSLADLLDAILPPNSSDLPVTEPDPLVETAALLAGAPKPQLQTEALARIQAQVLAAATQMPNSGQHLKPASRLLAVAAGGALVMIMVYVFSRGGPTPLTPTATVTLTPVPSATASLMATATTVLTATPLPSPSLVVVETTPEATATELPVSVVIEGRVEAITGSTVTIYGIPVEFKADDPILRVIKIGDTVRIEGSSGAMVTVVTTTIISAEVAVNPDTNQVWRDDGTCKNPPPTWAAANGWRRRCQPGSQPPPPGQNDNPQGGEGEGMGMGKDG